MGPDPKPKAFRSRKYLDWLRGKPCVFTGKKPCVGHHVRLLGGGGTAMKPPDNSAVPVYIPVHNKMNAVGNSEIGVYMEYWEGSRDEIKSRLRVLCAGYYGEWKGK